MDTKVSATGAFAVPANARVYDSITKANVGDRGCSVLAMSHGGAYCAHLALKSGLAGVILNDAGVGRAEAGIAALPLLEAAGIPALTLSHATARIGDGTHALAHGFVSHANGPAKIAGLAPGMAAHAALVAMAALQVDDSTAAHAAPAEEHRCDVTAQAPGPHQVITMDSASLMQPQDAGQIVITGSHGGLLGGNPQSAARVAVHAAIYNDAGVGCDHAGISRLPALEARGIAAACVSHTSARIGDGRSTFEDGIVSHLNGPARACGGEVGEPCRDLIAKLQGRR
ncbi:MAG: hypothetical protein AAFR04_06315 [Pseudomonadota bacterium]